MSGEGWKVRGRKVKCENIVRDLVREVSEWIKL